MEFKQIAKASKYLEEIKVLDAEIMAIDKMAVFISSNKSEIKLSINVKDLEKADKVEFDEDGSLQQKLTNDISRIYINWGFGASSSTPKEDTPLHQFNETIEDTVTLEVLAVLLFRKTTKRDLLINKINNLCRKPI